MTNQLRNVPDLRFPGFEGEWEESNIDNEFDFFNNKRKPIKENLRNKGEYPYYGATGIIDYVDDFIFDGNFILIGEDGANIVSRSAPLVYFATGKFWVNNHAHILYPKFGDIYFNYLLLENIDYEKYNTGTAQPKLNVQNLKKIKIKSPRDNSEQQKIGEFFSKLDRQIELEEKKLELLEQQKRGYMQKIFSQQLRFKDENGNDYPEWKKKKLDDVANYRRGSFPQPYGNKKWYDEKNGEPFVQVVDVDKNMKLHDKTKQKISDLAKPKSVKGFKGDIVVTLQGSIGRVAILQYDAYIDRTLLLINSFKIKMNKNYFKYVLYLLFLREKERAPGGTIKTITKAVLSNFEIDIPTLEEQNKIGMFFNEIDNLIELQNNKINHLKQRKQGLLQKMFV